MRPLACTLALLTAAPATALAQEPAEGPAAAPSLELRQWKERDRQLAVRTGVGFGFTGLTLGLALLPVAGLATCGRSDSLCSPLGAIIVSPVLGVITIALAIPSSIAAARLARHRRERPSARLQLDPGGLTLRF